MYNSSCIKIYPVCGFVWIYGTSFYPLVNHYTCETTIFFWVYPMSRHTQVSCCYDIDILYVHIQIPSLAIYPTLVGWTVHFPKPNALRAKLERCDLHAQIKSSINWFNHKSLSFIWLVVWNIWIIFHSVGNNSPNWHSYFSEGFNPLATHTWIP